MEVYTVRDVAEEFGVHEETVRTWIRKGELKAEKTSNRNGYIITEEDLDDFCDNVREPDDFYEDEESDELITDDEAEELMLKTLDNMIERLERERKVIEVKLKLAYIAREKIEA